MFGIRETWLWIPAPTDSHNSALSLSLSLSLSHMYTHSHTLKHICTYIRTATHSFTHVICPLAQSNTWLWASLSLPSKIKIPLTFQEVNNLQASTGGSDEVITLALCCPQPGFTGKVCREKSRCGCPWGARWWLEEVEGVSWGLLIWVLVTWANCENPLSCTHIMWVLLGMCYFCQKFQKWSGKKNFIIPTWFQIFIMHI